MISHSIVRGIYSHHTLEGLRTFVKLKLSETFCVEESFSTH